MSVIGNEEKISTLENLDGEEEDVMCTIGDLLSGMPRNTDNNSTGDNEDVYVVPIKVKESKTGF